VDLTKLRNEITNDPEAIGYAGKTDAEVADLLNARTRPLDRDSLTGGELAASLVRTELAGLPNGDQNYIRALIPAGTMPLTAQLKTELGSIFPGGSATRQNLLALLKRFGSRAEELGLGPVGDGHVASARAT
jgi:hypothetical protein